MNFKSELNGQFFAIRLLVLINTRSNINILVKFHTCDKTFIQIKLYYYSIGNVIKDDEEKKHFTVYNY